MNDRQHQTTSLTAVTYIWKCWVTGCRLLIRFGPKEFCLLCDTSCESLMKNIKLKESGSKPAGPADKLESKSETGFRF